VRPWSTFQQVLGDPNSSRGALWVGGGEAKKKDRVVTRIAEHQPKAEDAGLELGGPRVCVPGSAVPGAVFSPAERSAGETPQITDSRNSRGATTFTPL